MTPREQVGYLVIGVLLAVVLFFTFTVRGDAQIMRGRCVEVTSGDAAFVKVTLPPRTDVWVTRRGHDLDPNDDGMSVIGRWIMLGVWDDRHESAVVYLSIFRIDKRPGRFCFTVHGA